MRGDAGALDERLVAAHGALREGGDVQFTMAPAAGPTPPPAWLQALGEWLERVLAPIGRFLHWIGSFMPDAPYARIILWTMIAVTVLFLLWMIQDRIRHGEWGLPRLRRRRTAASVATDEDRSWAPEAAPARAWLQEADALAAQGQYGEAVHHLLLRSVEDLSRRRPQVVRPALTSRDLAGAEGIPPAPRRLFAEISAVVERSLFGGSTVGAEQWSRCRAAYTDFAQARTWKA